MHDGDGNVDGDGDGDGDVDGHANIAKCIHVYHAGRSFNLQGLEENHE